MSLSEHLQGFKIVKYAGKAFQWKDRNYDLRTVSKKQVEQLVKDKWPHIVKAETKAKPKEK